MKLKLNESIIANGVQYLPPVVIDADEIGITQADAEVLVRRGTAVLVEEVETDEQRAEREAAEKAAAEKAAAEAEAAAQAEAGRLAAEKAAAEAAAAPKADAAPVVPGAVDATEAPKAGKKK